MTKGQARDVAGQAPLPIEIGFLADHGWSPDVLRYAARLAAKTGVGADEALVRSGLVKERDFYRALARELKVPFANEPRLSERSAFPESILAGLAPLAGGGIGFALAPHGSQLARLLARRALLGSHLVLTTPAALKRAVFRVKGKAIARGAANGLPDAAWRMSIRDGGTVAQIVIAAILVGGLSFAGPLVPHWALGALAIGLGPLFLTMVTFRLLAAAAAADVAPADGPERAEDATLPVYSVVVALHQERRVAARLVAALSRLDYPPTKLDIKLVIETDDHATAAALAIAGMPAHFERIVAPPGYPRTKPRALNVALPLLRGDYTVVYDADDVPEPGQLRLAVAAFAQVPAKVACLQARLTIDNCDDTWLTRLFTIEYASLFDVLNPTLARLGSPIPLGGTSNHFRTAILRSVCGWDAWNVTEDADLGIRLARLGYFTADLPSSTFEEAPLKLRAWMRQRTRWMKGFVQTCVTHSRQPVVAMRQLGFARFWSAVALTFGTVISALGYPLFTLVSIAGMASGLWRGADSFLAWAWIWASTALFAGGALAIFLPAVLGLHRRGLRRLLPWVLLLPIYYLLISFAAWRSLVELARDPFGWNKTDHGLARTSRRRTLKSASTRHAPPPRAGA